MYSNHKQSGRSRVNLVFDRKKKGKVHEQHKVKKVTGVDKLFQLQNELFKDGMKPSEYQNYIQEKINNEKYYYKNLSNSDFERLKIRYNRMAKTKENNLNFILSDRKRKKRQKKLFKERKRNIIKKQKQGVIEELFKELSKTKAIGVGKKVDMLSSDTDKWNETKKVLFTGGRYFEKADKEWSAVYQKLISENRAHLFNMQSTDDLNEYVMNYDNIIESVHDQ